MIHYTERLILRPWEDSDADFLFNYAKDERVGPATGWPPHKSIEESRRIIADILSVPETYAVVPQSVGHAVGSISIMRKNQSNIDLNENDAEIGYWIGVAFWGQGLIPEAVRKLTDYAFNVLHIDNLWCMYFDNNIKSKRVQEKCGFKYHHTQEIFVKALNETKTVHVTCITNEEYNTFETSALQNKETSILETEQK